MAQNTHTFRVFVSSTFSDLKAERNALQAYVFPRLRELCENPECMRVLCHITPAFRMSKEETTEGSSLLDKFLPVIRAYARRTDRVSCR